MTSVNTSTQQQLQLLTNPNAYKCANGLLMQVWSNLAEEEMKLNSQNAEMQAEAMQASAEAAGEQASASIMGSVAESIDNGVSAAGEGFSAAQGTSALKETSDVHNEYQAKIEDKQTQIDNINSPTGLGNRPNPPAGQVNRLEQEKTSLMNEKSHRQSMISNKLENSRSMKMLVSAVAQGGAAVSRGQTGAATAQAQNSNQMAQSLAGQFQSNQKTDQDVAQTALSFNPGNIALAQARG